MVSFTLRPHWLRNRGLNKPERINSCRAKEKLRRAWLTKLLTPRNCNALSLVMLWRLMETNITYKQRWLLPNSHRRVSNAGKKRPYSQGGVLMTTTTLQYISCSGLINCWNWKKKQFRICDDHHRAKGLTNCYWICFFFLSSLVCLVSLKTDGLDNP